MSPISKNSLHFEKTSWAILRKDYTFLAMLTFLYESYLVVIYGKKH